MIRNFATKAGIYSKILACFDAPASFDAPACFDAPANFDLPCKDNRSFGNQISFDFPNFIGWPELIQQPCSILPTFLCANIQKLLIFHAIREFFLRIFFQKRPVSVNTRAFFFQEFLCDFHDLPSHSPQLSSESV
nr:MAG TPA: hypothetical protein [Bacteriophage sp.]